MKLDELNQKTVRACDEAEGHLKTLLSFIIRKRQRAHKNQVRGWDELGDVARIKKGAEDLAPLFF